MSGDKHVDYSPLISAIDLAGMMISPVPSLQVPRNLLARA
jgi:hypothetical protein